MNTKILFVHVPKAAGSSIIKFFTDQLSSEEYMLHLELDKSRLQSSNLENIRFVEGHLPLFEYESNIEISNYYLITSVREPLSHLISHISFIRNFAEPGHEKRLQQQPQYVQDLALKLASLDMSSHHFLSKLTPEELNFFNNAQFKYFQSPAIPIDSPENIEHIEKSLKKFNAIGITENLNPFFKKISNDLNLRWGGEQPKENIQSKKYGLSADNKLFIEAAEPLIRLDKIVYEIAKKIENSKTANTTKPSKGHLDIANNSYVSGWCALSDSAQNASVAIFVNGTKVGSTIACADRPDVHAAGMHPTGKCGFTFEFSKDASPKQGDVIQVMVENDHFNELTNSPKTI